jgi:hypothetical protein
MGDREFLSSSTIILVAWALAVLIFYVIDQKRHLEMTWWRCIADPPAGISVALPMIGVKFGILLTRGALWSWRQFGGGALMAPSQKFFVLIGTVITALALLWLVRVLSRAHYGDWAWIAAAGSALAYIFLTSLDASS